MTRLTSDELDAMEATISRSVKTLDTDMMERLIDEVRCQRQDLEACRAVIGAAIEVEPCSDDEWMVPIGGGNPYYHCRKCGVTNVQLNMGVHSRTHAEWCDVIFPLRRAIEALPSHLREKP